MADYSVVKFVGPLVGLMISAIILGALLGIFAGITMPDGYEYGDILTQVFDIIPLELYNTDVLATGNGGCRTSDVRSLLLHFSQVKLSTQGLACC